MRYIPFENWVTVKPAPDLHQYAKGIELAPSYSRRKAKPGSGRWFRVVETGEQVPDYLGKGAPVICNVAMLSDYMAVGQDRFARVLFTQCAGILIGPETMKNLETRHPIIPIGDYVLMVDNDEKHSKILGMREGMLAPEHMLRHGQRTDEAYENEIDPMDPDGQEIQRVNRLNDGVKVLFSEVVSIGPGVAPGRLEKGDMAEFRPNVTGISFDCFGVSYRLARCSEKNSEIMGCVPRAVFE